MTKLSDGANTRMDEVSADLSLTHSDNRWTLLGRRVRAQRGGRRDPNSEFDVSWQENDSGMLELEAKANYLRAEALLPLVGLMPQKDIRDRLRELAPTGEWMDMRLALQRPSAGESVAVRCARQVPRRRVRAARTRSGASRSVGRALRKRIWRAT